MVSFKINRGFRQMNINNISNISMPVKSIEKVSPSKYEALKKCILREVWGANREIKALLPVSPSIKVGTVIHKVLETASDGKIKNHKDFMVTWDNEINRIERLMSKGYIEKHLVPLTKAVYNFQVKKQLCEEMVEKFYGSNVMVSSGSENPHSEVAVESKDKKVFGKIDLINSNERGIQIIDYKTGMVYHEVSGINEIKQEYQQQLKLYAALYYQTYDIWPTRLTIVTLDEKESDIEFKTIECEELLNEATKLLGEVNRRISTIKSEEELASPTVENCRYCVYRPACSAYWKRRDSSNDWPLDITGHLEQVNLLKNGTLRAVIKTVEEEISIRGLNLERNHFILDTPKGTAISFYNLERDSISSCYHEVLLSMCYIDF